MKRKYIHLNGIPEEADSEKGTQSIFEQIIAENLPNLGREIGIQIQEIERSPSKINKNCTTPPHLILKLANSKDKEKILKQQETRDPSCIWGEIFV